MSPCIDTPLARPTPTLAQFAGRLWRRLTQRRSLAPHLMSPHMLRDLGLPDALGEDPLARDRLRPFL